MTTELRIESKTLALGEVLQNFYVVPNYQREYIWQRENVETMLNDILNEFDRQKKRGNQTAEYFLGSIVVCESQEDASFDLIDGQQRMTTLYLLLCVIRDYMLDKGHKIPVSLTTQISSSTQQRLGGEVHRYRVELHYNDGKDLIESFGNHEIDSHTKISELLEANDTSETVRNLMVAYQAIFEFLQSNFDNADDVERFWSQSIYDVKLIRIVTGNLTQALQIFETINERGVGLNAMDLLKNLLFMRANPHDSDDIAKRWKAMIDKLQRSEKPLRFLRYFILSQYDIDTDTSLTESDIYPWFRDNTKVHRLDDNPMAFLEKLIDFSNVYLGFIDGKNPDGSDNKYLRNISILTTSTARQHYILLMAGRHLKTPQFLRLCAELENTMFCYVLTRQRTNVLERNIIPWARKLRAVSTGDELEGFFRSTLWTDLKSRRRDFEAAFLSASLANIPKYRMRYTLGKLILHIEAKAGNLPPSLDDVAPKRSKRGTPQIEHILPVSPSDDLRNKFNKPDEYDQLCQMLGNLTLLSGSINASISNKPFAEKRESYAENSQFLLTRSIARKLEQGNGTQFDLAIADLKQFEEWNSEAILARQEMLLQIAREVWLSVAEKI